jgi:hypothetical protein
MMRCTQQIGTMPLDRFALAKAGANNVREADEGRRGTRVGDGGNLQFQQLDALSLTIRFC